MGILVLRLKLGYGVFLTKLRRGPWTVDEQLPVTAVVSSLLNNINISSSSIFITIEIEQNSRNKHRRKLFYLF